MIIDKIIKVKLPYLAQNIFIGKDLSDSIVKSIIVSKFDKVLILVDSKVYSQFIDFIVILQNKSKAPLVKISSDTKKDYNQVRKLLLKINKYNLSRKSCLLVIGGGHIGDLAGFIASVYMRGIDMIYVPTTLMSQCDTIIGKVGINFTTQKNLLGSFYSPHYTFCDANLIAGLTYNQVLCGLVETWKHSIIRNDTALLNEVKNVLLNNNKNIDSHLISRSILIKKYFVERDPYDVTGQHKSLSLGHTLANYLERDNRINHGEAVLYGIFWATLLSKRVHKINVIKYEKIRQIFDQFRQSINKDEIIIKLLNSKKLQNILLKDKINSNNQYNFVIPTKESWEILRNVNIPVIQACTLDLIQYLRANN